MAQGEQPTWRKFVMEAQTTGGLPPAPTSLVTAPTPLPGASHISPQFDVIETLPEERKDLLRKLRQRATDAHLLIPPFEQIRELSMAKIEAANAVNTLVSHPQDFGRGLSETDPLVIAAKKHLDKMVADFERLQALQTIRAASFQSASAAVANVEAWLKSGRPGNTTLEPVEVDVPKPAKGENGLLDQIETRRRRVRELRADLHRLASAPFPSSYAKQRMRGMIEALAQRGQPDVSLLIEHDGDIVWPTKRVKVDVLNAQPGAIGFAEIPDMLAIDAWRNKEAMLAKLDAEINTEADDRSALTHEAREKAEAEVMGDLLDIERQEAALCWAAMDERLPIEFRADCDPRAILGVGLVVVPRATELPPTSTGLSWPWRP